MFLSTEAYYTHEFLHGISDDPGSKVDTQDYMKSSSHYSPVILRNFAEPFASAFHIVSLPFMFKSDANVNNLNSVRPNKSYNILQNNNVDVY